MRKLKIVAIISGLMTLWQLIPIAYQIYLGIKFNMDMRNASAIGIIGGADGPTSIYIATASSFPMLIAYFRYGFLILCAITFIVSTIMYLRNKNK